jgi:CheY-like chemotaxis protein
MYGDRQRFPFPDIFLTDLRLGEESGIQFMEWIRSRPELEGLPVIVLSGSFSSGDVAAAKKLGASRVLAKPGDPFEFQKMVEKMSREFCPTNSEFARSEGSVSTRIAS